MHGDGVAHAPKGLFGLVDESYSLGDDKARAVPVGSPVEQRLPGVLLQLHEARRRGRAIAQQVGPGIFRGVGDDLLASRNDPIEAGCRQARQRQVGGVDLRLVRHAAPFSRNGVGQRPRGDDEDRFRRRAHGFAVKQHTKAALLRLDRRLLVEALHGARRGEGCCGGVAGRPARWRRSAVDGAGIWARNPGLRPSTRGATAAHGLTPV